MGRQGWRTARKPTGGVRGRRTDPWMKTFTSDRGPMVVKRSGNRKGASRLGQTIKWQGL